MSTDALVIFYLNYSKKATNTIVLTILMMIGGSIIAARLVKYFSIINNTRINTVSQKSIYLLMPIFLF